MEKKNENNPQVEHFSAFCCLQWEPCGVKMRDDIQGTTDGIVFKLLL